MVLIPKVYLYYFGQKQKILYLFSCPGVTKLTLILFIRGNNWANLLFLLK